MPLYPEYAVITTRHEQFLREADEARLVRLVRAGRTTRSKARRSSHSA
jgi:hypothetical protein